MSTQAGAQPDKVRIALTVNGRVHEVDVPPRRLLADVLRLDLELTGTNIGCAHGVCGSCTVLVDGESARSCLMFGVQADGAEITTIEGVAPSPREMHPIQEAFWEQQGLQCGFCTSGMVLRGLEILRENPNPTREQVREGIAGNLCRCTGYQFIVDAIMQAAGRMSSTTVSGGSDAGDQPLPRLTPDDDDGARSNPAPAAHP